MSALHMQKASYYAVHFVCHMGNMTVNNHIFVPSEMIIYRYRTMHRIELTLLWWTSFYKNTPKPFLGSIECSCRIQKMLSRNNYPFPIFQSGFVEEAQDEDQICPFCLHLIAPPPPLHFVCGIYKMTIFSISTKSYIFPSPWKYVDFLWVKNISLGQVQTDKPDVFGLVRTTQKGAQY